MEPLKTGRFYQTRGGWKAVVIWEHPVSFYPRFLVIHKPGSEEESGAILHNDNGEACTTFSINEPPRYNQRHPADLVAEWIDKEEEKNA